MIIKVLILACILLCINNTLAATNTYGEPTSGDYMRKNFENILFDTQQLAYAKGNFNAKISSARYKFFTTDMQSSEHKNAEIEFNSLLQGKDYIYLETCIKTGAEDGFKRLTVAFAISGGALDNGIPKNAVPFFSTWVTAIRQDLGVQGDQIYIITDPDVVIKAINKNEKFYKRYKAERDKAEFLQWRISHPEKNEIEGNLPLTKKEVKSLGEAHNAFPLGKVESLELRKILFDPNYKHQVLSCTYGPYQTENGATFQTYTFWYKEPPENIDELMLMDLGNSLSFLGNKGFTNCPQTDGVANNERYAAITLADSPKYASKRKELVAIAAEDKAKQREISQDNLQKQIANRTAITNRVNKDCKQLAKNYKLKYSGAQFSSRDISSEVYIVNSACDFNRENETELPTPVIAKKELICNLIEDRIRSKLNNGNDNQNWKPNPEVLKKLKASQAFVCDASFMDIDEKSLLGSTDIPSSTSSTTATVEDSSTVSNSSSSSKPAPNSLPTDKSSPPTSTETPVISQQEQSVLCNAMALSIAEAEQKAASMRDKITLLMSKNSYRLKCGGG